MAKFTDSEGRDWKLELNVGLLEDLKEATGVDLDAAIQNPEKISEIVFAAPGKMVEILWVLCEKQAKAVPLTPREFGRMFTREQLDRAVDAFLESILLFYPRTSVGGVIRESLPQMLRKMDQSMVNETRKKLTKALSDMPTD